MQLNKAVFRTTALYVLLAGLWIILSDGLLEFFFPSPSMAGKLQTIKGLLFVLITGALLYSLLRTQLKSVFLSESRLHGVFESISDALLFIDSDLRVTCANRSARKLFGLSEAEKDRLLLPFHELVRKFDIRNTQGIALTEDRAFFQALRGNGVRSTQALLQQRDGHRGERTLELDISLAPISAPEAGIRGAAVVMRDVTEIRRLQRLRDEFLSTAAHEFKTPLAVIKANAQLLQLSRGSWSDDKTLLSLKMIDRQCQKANRLVEDLLMGSKMEKDILQLQKSSFSMETLVKDLVDGMRELSPHHHLVLDFPLEEQSTTVTADRARIEQVLTNLIENAIKYSPSGGEVRISIYREGPRVWTSIRDFGIGIKKEKQHHVFEKYYSAHTGTSYDFGGMGIGLSLSRETILRHGGSIEFESEENQGSTFRFSLPAAQEDIHEQSA